VSAARARGFVINATGPHTHRLAPPLVLGDDDVAGFLAAWPLILDDAVDAAHAAEEQGSPA
jgi:acetylornithine aminotransferase